ncbi:hypothetical protein F4777DRAFT_181053 [Nemania sp. FL0916]|nr:hypothetical protein F4777DRAFT_181053 [Nemania sp. FL0916]
MAEALGVAASGIAVFQVATQVGKSIIKLRNLWNDLQDVPSSIEDLFDQIECLDPALWEAEYTFSHAGLPPIFWDDTIASRSTAYCRKALNSLTELVDDLASQVNRPGKFKSRLAAAKVVLKKEQIRVLEHRLQNAVRMLGLAQQSYSFALLKVQPHIIMQEFTSIARPLIAEALQSNKQQGRPDNPARHTQALSFDSTRPADDRELEDRSKALGPSLKDQKSVISYRLRLPTWLYRTTWELQSCRSLGNWKLNLRCYRIVSLNSEVMILTRRGKMRELQALFESGLASPWDRCEWSGETLLHEAASHSNIPMITYLMSLGADPSEPAFDGRYPINALLMQNRVIYCASQLMFSQSVADWFYTDSSKKLTDMLTADFDHGDGNCRCGSFGPPEGVFKIVRDMECPNHEKTTLKSRIEKLLGFSVGLVPRFIPYFLQPHWSQDLGALCRDSVAIFPLITIVAFALGRIDEWPPMADEMIRNTPDIHCVGRHRDGRGGPHRLNRSTPLIALIKGFSIFIDDNSLMSVELPSRLKLWLQSIKSAGYDLQGYGRRENEMLLDRKLRLDNKLASLINRKRGTPPRWEPRYLRGYEYGPEPDDWKILWAVRERSWSADFWKMVDGEPQPIIPGGWVEDSDDDQDDDWSDWGEDSDDDWDE